MTRSVLRRRGALISLTLALVTAWVGLGTATSVRSARSSAQTNSVGHFWAYENEQFGGHTHTLAAAVAAAQQFDVINAVSGAFPPDQVAAMHQANPALRIVLYLNGAFAQAGDGTKYPAPWYMYDAYGNKVKNDYNLWMMDVGNPSWRSTVGTICTGLLAKTGYDGCYLDNLGSGTLVTPLTGQPINPRTGQVWTNLEWLTATSSIAASVNATISPKPVLSNGLVKGSYYFDPIAPTKVLLTASGRANAETFIRTAYDGITTYRSVSSWKQDVDMVADAGASGGTIFLITKVWAAGTAAQIEQWHRYAFASALLGTSGTATFTFRPSKDSDTLAADTLAPKAATLGTPRAAYSPVSTGAYWRPFTNGWAIVNPQSTSVTVSLNGYTFHTIDGQAVTSVTLAPHSGEIITYIG